MKTKTLLTAAALCSTMLATAQQVSVNVETAGTLKDQLNLELTVSGKMDKTDFNFIDAFAGFKGLDMSAATIETYAPEGGTAYAANEIPDSAFMTSHYQNQNDVTVYTGNKSIAKFVLPASITAIGASAFNSSAATAVDFSACKALTTIKDHAFDLCGMEQIDLSGLTALKTIETYAFDQTHASAISLEDCSQLEELTNNVFSQSYFCTSLNFKGCTALKTIGNRAFLNLGKYMGDGKNGVEQTEAELDLTPCTALETIDVSAFQSMKFTSVKFPASLKSIGEKAFNLASKILTITFEGTVPPSLGPTAFTNKIMADATVYVPAGSEEAYKAAGFGNVQTITAVASARAEAAAAEETSYDVQGHVATDATRGIVVSKSRKFVK